MQFGQPVARDVRLLSDGVGFVTISCFQRINISQQMLLFQPFKITFLYQCDFISPRRTDEEALVKRKGKKSTILNTGKCMLHTCLEMWKDTLIILANYIPVRGEYIYIFNIQPISKNFFDQTGMPFILKCCAKISSLDSLMCEMMNLFSCLLQNAFHFSLQIKTPTLLTSVLPLLNTIFKSKRNHTRMVPLGFCLLTFLYLENIWEGKLMALCFQTQFFSKWREMSTYFSFASVTHSSVLYRHKSWMTFTKSLEQWTEKLD